MCQIIMQESMWFPLYNQDGRTSHLTYAFTDAKAPTLSAPTTWITSVA